jgi:type II secretory pathway pseudopilin PulG
MRLMTPTLKTARAARRRAAGEHGFTMVLALGVLLVTSLLLTGVFFALQGEIHSGTNDLAAKRAYAAAQAGIQAYLNDLNQNPNYWNTCANDIQTTPVTVPGSSDGATYTFAPVYANGNTSCTSNVINSLVDTQTGTIRMVFTGKAGTNPVLTRSIVVSFRMNTPLDFLWYTNYEAIDSSIKGLTDCNVYYRAPRTDTNCNINWVSGDVINGPMYTNDQYLILTGNTPTFGRSPADRIESNEPIDNNADICSGNNCGSANIKGTPVPDAPYVAMPSDNSELLTDAQSYGNVFTGTTSVTLGSPDGTHASVVTCTTSAASSCTSKTVDLKAQPIIYVNNASGCSVYQYSPFSVSYPNNGTGYYGCAGDVYVSGTYSTSVTIAAANNIIIDGNVQTSEDGSGNPTGTATLGLVADWFVRVMHGVNGTNPGLNSNCTATNTASQTLTNPTIDAAILALDHSLIVDNFNCGASPGVTGQPGTLTVNGAIAQDFRGPVGTSGTPITGYLKNYSYDDRLANILPPYLFDISNSGWHVSRETMCIPGSVDPTAGCNAPG